MPRAYNSIALVDVLYVAVVPDTVRTIEESTLCSAADDDTVHLMFCDKHHSSMVITLQ